MTKCLWVFIAALVLVSCRYSHDEPVQVGPIELKSLASPTAEPVNPFLAVGEQYLIIRSSIEQVNQEVVRITPYESTELGYEVIVDTVTLTKDTQIFLENNTSGTRQDIQSGLEAEMLLIPPKPNQKDWQVIWIEISREP